MHLIPFEFPHIHIFLLDRAQQRLDYMSDSFLAVISVALGKEGGPKSVQ